ncbi:large subunit ribosomal protein L7e [Angomonas deanei]|uniref:Ribosomal L30 N-terminal domain/Ribosomal protein L30p/L7e, putative n=1 Tax=Angomonas deanei TaxID=59799 RepID=S9ULY6_9TRYP|nr:large subunit ribosomal protein L7e [Angomonas deanei]EPY41777.1 large subunit ribosomal protein L7e [Angomonas deanei]EPY42324.1 large subunit ribosomal protein L7e [Angomonas deanei]CAD2215907.1 Ribosomal L30 N-terminal domain/Ribosomal protein L30p/L7e, putative [Angomonas deanei]CAD2215908.1 Ribosomal L30 N-terminal domain/Ribosomal protein L30p/L7e, putative [Angomonas deanei]|eukprot:EPY29739.1 large subunit ribosomal protein L7e [Angomonas deanei]
MPAVPAPESAVKRAAFKQQQTENFKEAIKATKAAKVALKKDAYQRGLKYSREYRGAEKRLVTLRRQATSNGNYYLEAKPKFAVVIRIRGIAKVNPKQRKILQLLRLRQIFNAVFVKMNKPMLNMLRAVEPFIAYGYPSLSTVRALVYKRGHLKINGQRVKINDNQLVKDKFHSDDVVCVEDMVNQIFTCGKHFRSVSHGLWPFKLAPPVGGMRQKRRHFVEGGDYGNRETLINSMLKRMI